MMSDLQSEHAGPAPPAGKDCEVVTPFIGVDWPCGNPAIGLFRRACVHEHIREVWVCRDHADTTELGNCRACWELPGGLSHDCPISLSELTA